VTDPEAWLAARLAEAPAALRNRIEAARPAPPAPFSVQRGASSGRFEDELRRMAEQLLALAKGGPPTHETALTLLAADALITLACEWVAETRPGVLADLR
jgi:hypothetical protein